MNDQKAHDFYLDLFLTEFDALQKCLSKTNIAKEDLSLILVNYLKNILFKISKDLSLNHGGFQSAKEIIDALHKETINDLWYFISNSERLKHLSQ